MSRADRTCTNTSTTSSEPFWSEAQSAARTHPPSRHYIVMFEEAQHPQLSENPLTGDQVLEDIGHLLQSHLAAVAWICNRPARETGRHSEFRQAAARSSCESPGRFGDRLTE